MNPSAPPSKDEKFDSLKNSYALLKDDYKTLFEKKNEIMSELQAVKSKLNKTFAKNSALQLEKRKLGKIFAPHVNHVVNKSTI